MNRLSPHSLQMLLALVMALNARMTVSAFQSGRIPSKGHKHRVSALCAFQPIVKFRKWRERRREERESQSYPISPLVQTNDWKRLQEEMDDWEDEDFLSAVNVRSTPKDLVHERDFFRVSTRVQAFDEYVIVSILCTSICYTSLTSTVIHPDHVGIFLYETVLRTAIQCTAGAAVLFGIYSTMVFSISILYGKTALGLEQDKEFDSFLDSTVDIRKNAFLSFSYSLGFFALMVVLNLAQVLPTVMHLPVGAAMIGFLYVFYRDWEVLTTAAEEIFEED
jgi:hypothetical protein